MHTEAKNIYCDGGGLEGHPRVYLAFSNDPAKENYKKTECPYCGKRFINPDSKRKPNKVDSQANSQAVKSAYNAPVNS